MSKLYDYFWGWFILYVLLFRNFFNYILYDKYINCDILYIIDDCCSFLNKKISKIIEEVSEFKDNYEPHYYALPWIITLFSRNNNLLDEMRLLDYFITSILAFYTFYVQTS